MPHVNIKHFPASLCEEQQAELVAALTAAVRSAFGCHEGMIPITLEPVNEDARNERVYVPEIVGRKEPVCKTPNY